MIPADPSRPRHACTLALVGCPPTLTVDPPSTARWTRQFGTSSGDLAVDVASDASGNVYAAGRTLGDLEGTNAGGWDAFVRSFDGAGGNDAFIRSFGP